MVEKLSCVLSTFTFLSVNSNTEPRNIHIVESCSSGKDRRSLVYVIYSRIDVARIQIIRV